MKQETKEKIKVIADKANFYKKYSGFIDKLILLISIWSALVLTFTFYDSLVHIKFPLILGTILFFIFCFTLSYITLKLLRPLVFVGVIIGLIYFSVFIIIDLCVEGRDKRKTENTQKFVIDPTLSNAINQVLQLNPAKDSASETNIINLQTQMQAFKIKMDSMHNNIDSLTAVIKNLKEK